MVVIVSDINKKILLLAEKEKIKVLSSAKLISAVQFINVIEPIDEYHQKLKKIYRSNYPIYKEFSSERLKTNDVSTALDFDNGEKVILPNFNGSFYWINIVIENKNEFLKFMYQNGYFDSFSMICLNKKKIYDIEFGEYNYELRACNY